MLLPSLCLLVLSALAAVGRGASLVQVKDFGANPTKINMYIYVPDKLATKPAVIVAVGFPPLPLPLLHS
jgi:acetylxylan esterase